MTRKKETLPSSSTKKEPAAPLPLPMQLLTVDEVAETLSVSRSTVYLLMRENGLPYTSVGQARRVHLDSLDWWVKQHECSTDPQTQAYLERQRTPRTEAPIETIETIAKRRSARPIR